MSDNDTGYRNPPKANRIKKGEVRNPNGRRGKNGVKKPAQDNSTAAIIERIDAEEIEVQGKTMTRRECELRVLQTNALKGNARASALLEALRTKAHVNKPTREGGVLLLPAPVPLHEWTASAAIQQSPFREAHPSYLLDDDEEP